MKIEEVRSKPDEELDFELSNNQKELFDINFRAATEAPANPAKAKELRRSIARIKTVLHERSSGVRGQERR